MLGVLGAIDGGRASLADAVEEGIAGDDGSYERVSGPAAKLPSRTDLGKRGAPMTASAFTG